MLESQVLQVAFAGLVTNRAIQRVVDQQKLNDRFTRFQYGGVGDIFYHHTILNGGGTGGHQFGHGSLILF